MPPSSPAPLQPLPQALPNQFALLLQRRYAPFFWTQFLGAANDNLFKFALIVLVTYQIQLSWMPPALAGLVISAVFVLPFLLFSASSGQLADKLGKARLMRLVKSMEIGIMLLASVGFLQQQVVVLLFCTFLMGLHSTLFGPAKYAYLPQVLSEPELTGGTGMVEMGTFVAILLGQLAGGLLMAIADTGARDVALACIALAVLGRLTAGVTLETEATDPQLKFNWNPFSETWRNLQLARENRGVFHALLAISWMWFFGATFLSQFPSLAKEVLHGDAQVASFLLVIFSLGIGLGSLLCEMLNREHAEIGLVPFGAIGMTLFSIDLYFALNALPPSPLMGVAAFLQGSAHWRVIIDLTLLSMSTGLYSVPLYALIQLRSRPSHRARVVAANNILNALFMIGSSLIAGVLLSVGVHLNGIILLIGLANAGVMALLFTHEPEYPRRWLGWIRAKTGLQ